MKMIPSNRPSQICSDTKAMNIFGHDQDIKWCVAGLCRAALHRDLAYNILDETNRNTESEPPESRTMPTDTRRKSWYTGMKKDEQGLRKQEAVRNKLEGNQKQQATTGDHRQAIGNNKAIPRKRGNHFLLWFLIDQICTNSVKTKHRAGLVCQKP